VLLIDDDVELAQLLGKLFTRECLTLLHAATVAEGHVLQRREQPAVVILDLMLPDGHGLDMCRQLRASSPLLPILILTARGDPVDRVLGLELGADDYLAKPFEARELLARVRALLRRQQAVAAAGALTPSRIGLGALSLDALQMSTSLRGQALSLTQGEFRLLLALAQRPGQTLSRDVLAEAVQPGQYRPLERAVDVQIARLRRKLRAAGQDCIRTVRGEGYTLVPPDSP
jgi:two-component system, OmpR family, phosphate regulon response regulator OmpR